MPGMDVEAAVEAAIAEPRGKSRSAEYRTQFAWAEHAVGASSTIAGAWLQKPGPEGESMMVGLFYFRRKQTNGDCAQVWRVARTKTGIKTTFVGSAPGHKEAYARHYQPLLKSVRSRQKEARKAAMESAKERARRASDMAARLAVGQPAKNDKRDLARATA